MTSIVDLWDLAVGELIISFLAGLIAIVTPAIALAYFAGSNIYLAYAVST